MFDEMKDKVSKMVSEILIQNPIINLFKNSYNLQWNKYNLTITYSPNLHFLKIQGEFCEYSFNTDNQKDMEKFERTLKTLIPAENIAASVIVVPVNMIFLSITSLLFSHRFFGKVYNWVNINRENVSNLEV